MTDLAEAVRDRLIADVTVAGIVSGRIHWQLRPQGDVLPAIVLTMVDSFDLDPIDEDVPAMTESRVQLDCYARTHAAAWQLAAAAKTALKPSAVQGTVEFHHADIEGPRDLGALEDTGFVHRATLDILLRHQGAA